MSHEPRLPPAALVSGTRLALGTVGLLAMAGAARRRQGARASKGSTNAGADYLYDVLRPALVGRRHKGWSAQNEDWIGTLLWSHAQLDVDVFATPGWEGQLDIPLQITLDDGHKLDFDEIGPFVFHPPRRALRGLRTGAAPAGAMVWTGVLKQDLATYMHHVGPILDRVELVGGW